MARAFSYFSPGSGRAIYRKARRNMRSGKLLYAGLIALVAIGASSVPAEAQSWYSAGPYYYAFPTWSQKIPGGRFVVMTDWNNEAVLDKETGLVWQRTPSPAHTNQFNAIASCEIANIGGRYGWRLPFVHELASLLDPTVTGSGPFVSGGHPFTVPGMVGDTVYWSASSDPANPVNQAMVVTFYSSPSVGPAPKLNQYYVWCVRGGNAARQ